MALSTFIILSVIWYETMVVMALSSYSSLCAVLVFGYHRKLRSAFLILPCVPSSFLRISCTFLICSSFVEVLLSSIR